MIDLNKLDESKHYVVINRLMETECYEVFYLHKCDDEWIITEPDDDGGTLYSAEPYLSDIPDSNVKLFDVNEFNSSVSDKCIVKYYDAYGIRILDDMGVFVRKGDCFLTSYLVSVFEKNNDYYADYGFFGNVEMLVSFEHIKTKIFVKYIPAYYIEQKIVIVDTEKNKDKHSVKLIRKSNIFICDVSESVISELLECGRAFIPTNLLDFNYDEYSDYTLVVNGFTYCFCQFDTTGNENEIVLRLLSYWKE